MRCAPVAGSSEGPNAVWLAASYGLAADPWQARLLADWMGVRDGRWAASRCGGAVPRQNGKNGALEVLELCCTVALGERVLHTAHEVKTARKAFARLLEFFDNPRSYPELAGMVKEIRRTNGQEAIVLDNGGSVEFIARSRGSGRGFSVDKLVADEAQELTEDAWAALLPTISASDNPQVVLTGTPPPPGAAGEVFTRMRQAGVEGTDGRLAWSEWSCDDDLALVDLDARVLWASVNPALGTRLRVETIADERAVMDPQTFARERLGWWQPVDQAGAAFDLDRWAALIAPTSRPVTPCFGVAVALDRSWTAIAAAWRALSGRVRVEVVANDRGTDWVADRVARLQSEHGRGTVAASQTARGLVPGADERNLGALADNALADLVAAGALEHAGQPELTTSIRAARWKPSGDSRVLDRKGTTDISPLTAAALAVHALTSEPPRGGWMVGL